MSPFKTSLPASCHRWWPLLTKRGRKKLESDAESVVIIRYGGANRIRVSRPAPQDERVNERLFTYIS